MNLGFVGQGQSLSFMSEGPPPRVCWVPSRRVLDWTLLSLLELSRDHPLHLPRTVKQLTENPSSWGLHMWWDSEQASQ